MELKYGDKVALVGCSNPQSEAGRGQIEALTDILGKMGLVPVLGGCIYEKDERNADAVRKTECLMNFYRDEDVKVIFDISGGDMANEILPYLDYETIAESDKQFWGYSDLTTIINAIYAKTGKASVLYQVRNLVGRNGEMQQENFFGSMMEGTSQLFSFDYEFVQGNEVCGVVVGGNIRCLLKLAGTPYWPDMNGKILFLESRSGTVPQMVTFFSQLKQIGVFEQIQGLVLGTFTQMEREACRPDIVEIAKQCVGEHLPIIKTQRIGHGSDSKALVIGAMHCFI